MKSIFNGAGYTQKLTIAVPGAGWMRPICSAPSHCQKLIKASEWRADGGFGQTLRRSRSIIAPIASRNMDAKFSSCVRNIINEAISP